MSSAFLRSAACVPSCSGRGTTGVQSTSYVRLPIGTAQRSTGRRSAVVVHAVYNFTDSKEDRQPGERRNRGLLKKEARGVLEVVRGLTSMSGKQLAAVAHLLPSGTLEAVKIANKIPGSNQGRKRQEALVAKMLRGGLAEGQLDKLGDAVALAADNAGVWDDGEVSGLVTTWRDGLLAGDEAVTAEVFGYPRTWAPDHQQLTTLVRQIQQLLAEESEVAAKRQAERSAAVAALLPSGPNGAAAADARPADASTRPADGGAGGGEGADGVEGREDEDDLADVLAEAAARSGGARAGRATEPLRSRAPLRALTKMLKPLAMRVVAEV